MKVLKSWLKEYINFEWNDQEISDKLSFSGTLVDNYISKIDDNVIVVEVRKIIKHPKAEKLKIAEVYDGKDKYEIVCGASNIKVGQKVPLAKIGSKLSGKIINQENIRGINSIGMLCSEFELEISENNDGIMVLNDRCELGNKLSKYFNSDTVFDLEITPNRGDCLSHIGIAREVGALLHKSIKKRPIKLKMSNISASSVIKLNIKENKLCPNYFARVIQNVKIGPSPEWLKSRLELCGVKTINNIVDVTNYVMYDLGQPLHAFDLDKISDKNIIVRKAKKSEKIITIDHVTKVLSSNDLVIADAKKPIAIAGVMGGADSEISSKTDNIVIEAAEFERKSIRKTSKNLSLSSEASYRFERGIDPVSIEYAINKTAKIIQQVAGGTILSGIVSHKVDYKNEVFEFDHDKINNLIGTSLNRDEIDSILISLGFKIYDNICVVPSYRKDVSIWQDLAEEIVRIHGLNNIKLIKVVKTSTPKKSSYYRKEYIKDILVKIGFSETFGYPFMSKEDLKITKLYANNMLEIANPIQPENKYLRQSLIPGLFKTVSKNPLFDPVLIFEIGNIFSKKSENTCLGVVASGKLSPDYINNAKDLLLSKLKIKEDKIKIQELSRDDLKRFKIKKPFTYAFEMDLTNIDSEIKIPQKDLDLKVSNKDTHYRPVSKYPSYIRDLAFVLDKSIKSSDISNTIYGISELINRVELFDEFSSDKLGKNKKNLAYHIYLQSPEYTLNDNDANEIILNIIKIVEKKYNAKLRA